MPRRVQGIRDNAKPIASLETDPLTQDPCLSLPGRILFLSSDPEIVEAQLARRNIDFSELPIPCKAEIVTVVDKTIGDYCQEIRITWVLLAGDE